MRSFRFLDDDDDDDDDDEEEGGESIIDDEADEMPDVFWCWFWCGDVVDLSTDRDDESLTLGVVDVSKLGENADTDDIFVCDICENLALALSLSLSH